MERLIEQQKSYLMQYKQTGFTIIELVVVVILLGILAATALPRFLNVDDQTHAAVVTGVMGSLQTGVSLYHARWIADGEPAANTQIAEFNNLRTNAQGFPYGTVNNSAGTSTVTTAADCKAIFDGILQAAAPSSSSVETLADVSGSLTDFTLVQAAPNCRMFYTARNNQSGQTVPEVVYDSTAGVLSRTAAVLP